MINISSTYFQHTPVVKEPDVAPWKERSVVVRRVVGSILPRGPIELFLVPAKEARCRSVVTAFTHGGPIELFHIPPNTPRLV